MVFFLHLLLMFMLMPVIAGLYTSGQFSNALHLHGGNLLLKSHILSGMEGKDVSYLENPT